MPSSTSGRKSELVGYEVWNEVCFLRRLILNLFLLHTAKIGFEEVKDGKVVAVEESPKTSKRRRSAQEPEDLGPDAEAAAEEEDEEEEEDEPPAKKAKSSKSKKGKEREKTPVVASKPSVASGEWDGVIRSLAFGGANFGCAFQAS